MHKNPGLIKSKPITYFFINSNNEENAMAWEINDLSCPPELKEEDIMDVMKSIEGYLDITPSDFMEVYKKAYQLARNRLLHDITAEMIMTDYVHSIEESESIARAALVMAESHVSGLPVINENNEIVGIISEKDFLREMSEENGPSFMAVVAQCLNNKGCVALPIKKSSVKDIMSAPAVTVDKKATLYDVINLLKEKGINRVPIKDKNNRIAGIITRADIINAIFTNTCSLEES